MDKNEYYISNIPLVFNLIWKNEIINILAWQYREYIDPQNMNITYHISKIWAPSCAKNQRDILKILIYDAFIKHGIPESYKDKDEVHIRITKIVEPIFKT